jgi:hypothetical protein
MVSVAEYHFLNYINISHTSSNVPCPQLRPLSSLSLDKSLPISIPFIAVRHDSPHISSTRELEETFPTNN